MYNFNYIKYKLIQYLHILYTVMNNTYNNLLVNSFHIRYIFDRKNNFLFEKIVELISGLFLLRFMIWIDDCYLGRTL